MTTDNNNNEVYPDTDWVFVSTLGVIENLNTALEDMRKMRYAEEILEDKRRMNIAITDLEKVLAYIEYWL